MSDQNAPRVDRWRSRRAQNEAGNRRGRDLRLIAIDLGLALIFAACPLPRSTPLEAPPEAIAELFVDASALPGGDGTQGHPLKQLPRVLAHVHVVLSSGLYPGPFELGDGAALEGRGTAVLVVEGAEGDVVTVRGDAALRQLSVQGGARGVVVASGVARLAQVHGSGHRQLGVRVEPGAQLNATGLELEAVGPDFVGVQAERATVTVDHLRVRSGRRAVVLRQSTATLAHVTGEGAATLVHALDSVLVVRDASSAGGVGPAFFVSGGQLTLERGSAVGHEYGLQVKSAQVEVRGFSSRGAQQAGVALQQVTGALRQTLVEQAQSGGVVLLDDTLTVDGLEVRDVVQLGVMVRKGTVSLAHVRVSGVRADGESGGEPTMGDGLVLRDAAVTLDDVAVRDTEGPGVSMSAVARVTARQVVVERAVVAGVLVELGAQFEARSLVVHGAHGPAVLVNHASVATIGSLESSGVESAVWAECEAGAVVRLTTLSGSAPFFASRCVVRAALPER